MKIAFVFTNYNNSNFTRTALDSIVKSDAKGMKVIVVDNASSQIDRNALIELEKRNDFLKVIYNDENVGYFGGLNIGIQYVCENCTNVDCIVVGNNDLIFPTDFVASISACQNRLDQYPVISPNIVTLDGLPQNPHVISSISTFREIIYDLYHLNYYLAWSIKKVAQWTHKFSDREDERQHEVAQEIYQGYGACYILTPVFFQNFKQLWNPTFLMYEEFFLSKQLSDKGFKTFYEPSIMIKHHWHAATDKLPSRLRWELSRDSHKEYRKYVKVR